MGLALILIEVDNGFVLRSVLKTLVDWLCCPFVSGNTAWTTLLILDVSSWSSLTDYEDRCIRFYSAMCFRCVSGVI